MKRAPLLLLLFAPISCGHSDNATPVDAGLDSGEEVQEGPPPCVNAVNKGPWALAVNANSAKIRWESCKKDVSGIGYLPEGPAGAPTKVASTVTETKVSETIDVGFLKDADWAGTYYMHEVALTGLKSGTCYEYTVDADASIKGRFCTARDSGASFSFAAVGDTNPGLGVTAQLIDQVYPTRKPDFTVHGGDLQYYSSGLETYTFWFARLAKLFRTGAFYPAIGNHESERPSERADYYDRFFGGAGFDGSKDWFRFSSGGVWFFVLNTEIDFGPTTDQGKWLLANLEDAQKQTGFRFSVLVQHRPFVTCGDSGQKDGERKAYEPSFTKFGVKLAIGAHMHGYERFEMGDMTYVTAAGGGGLLGNVDENLSRPECSNRKASGAFFNIVVFDVKPGKLSGVAIDEKGATRDTFEKVVP